MYRSYVLLFLMPLLVTLGQLLMKKNASGLVIGQGAIVFIRSVFRPGIIAAGVCVAGAPLLYIMALDSVPLSNAFAFNSLNYILVFAGSRIILREKVNLLQITGVILITAGFLFPFIAGGHGA